MELYILEKSELLLKEKPELKVGLELVKGSHGRIFLKINNNKIGKAKTVVTLKDNGKVNIYVNIIEKYGFDDVCVYDDAFAHWDDEYINKLVKELEVTKAELIEAKKFIRRTNDTVAMFNRMYDSIKLKYKI